MPKHGHFVQIIKEFGGGGSIRKQNSASYTIIFKIYLAPIDIKNVPSHFVMKRDACKENRNIVINI